MLPKPIMKQNECFSYSIFEEETFPSSLKGYFLLDLIPIDPDSDMIPNRLNSDSIVIPILHSDPDFHDRFWFEH